MLRSFACLLALFLAFVASAEQSVNPGINRAYENADFGRWQDIFERDGREVWDRREDIIRHLRLRPGQRIADVGAGTGFFAMLMAGAVGPEGRVYAVDITPSFVTETERRAKDLGLNNVIGVINDPHGTRLSPNSVDLVFISDTYHHFEYPQSTLRSIYEALTPNGELVVIDFKRVRGFSSPWVLDHVRAGEPEVIAEIEASGFSLVERLDFMRTQYYLRFSKR